MILFCTNLTKINESPTFSEIFHPKPQAQTLDLTNDTRLPIYYLNQINQNNRFSMTPHPSAANKARFGPPPCMSIWIEHHDRFVDVHPDKGSLSLSLFFNNGTPARRSLIGIHYSPRARHTRAVTLCVYAFPCVQSTCTYRKGTGCSAGSPVCARTASLCLSASRCAPFLNAPIAPSSCMAAAAAPGLIFRLPLPRRAVPGNRALLF